MDFVGFWNLRYISGNSWMYPDPNVPRHGKSLWLSPIYPYNTWVFMGYYPQESLYKPKSSRFFWGNFQRLEALICSFLRGYSSSIPIGFTFSPPAVVDPKTAHPRRAHALPLVCWSEATYLRSIVKLHVARRWATLHLQKKHGVEKENLTPLEIQQKHPKAMVLRELPFPNHRFGYPC